MYWLERSERVAISLANLINGESATSFIDSICRQYIGTQNEDLIHNPAIRASRLTISIQRYHDEVLQLVGVGPELQRVSGIENDVRNLTRWLEELMCSVMTGYNDVVRTYEAKGFAFQL